MRIFADVIGVMFLVSLCCCGYFYIRARLLLEELIRAQPRSLEDTEEK